MRTIILLLLLFLAQPAFAQPGVTLGAGQGSGGFVTAYSTANFAVSGTDCVVLLACVYNVAGSGSQVTTAVTWNTSESFTHLVTQGVEPDDAGNISLWYLIDPTQTTENVDFSITDSSTSVASVAIVTGTSCEAPTLNNTGSGDPASAELTTTVDNTLLFACAGNGNSSGTFTYGAGQSELSLVQEPAASGITHTLSTEVKVTAGAETLSVDSDQNDSNRLVVTGIEPADTAAGRRRRAPWSFR